REGGVRGAGPPRHEREAAEEVVEVEAREDGVGPGRVDRARGAGEAAHAELAGEEVAGASGEELVLGGGAGGVGKEGLEHGDGRHDRAARGRAQVDLLVAVPAAILELVAGEPLAGPGGLLLEVAAAGAEEVGRAAKGAVAENVTLRVG